ncbi:MAG: hypothetical protein IJ642_12355 [Oscillospiraceae bacterium]|nr:hypothetical protein [Oscillospiraceae bacterium]
MKMAKKCFSLLILGCLALSVTACGSKKTESENTQESTESETVPLFETALAASETTVTTVSETETSTSTETTETETTTSEETTTTTDTTEITTTTTETTTTTTETTTETTTITVPPTVDSAPETAPGESTAAVTQMFEPGIWWSTSSDGDRYFCFYTGSDSGSFRDQENGINMDFNYEAENENTIIFHIGSMDSSTQVQATFPDSNTAVLTWENGTSETLAYQGLGNFDTFRFYSNLELCEMALDYYEARNDYRPADAVAEVQPDRTIMIQLYDNLGDHNSTSAWYTVDRFTAKGTDIIGNAIDLTETN